MLDSLLGLFMAFAPSAQNYDQVVKQMEAVAQKNPAQIEIFTLGTNDQGVPIKGLKIGHGATNSLVVGTHHGNEYGSTAVALGLGETLSLNPIQNQTVYLIPVLNISGYNRYSRYETSVKGSAVDSNRDYTSPCKSSPSFTLRSTELLAQFVNEKNIVISATLHTHWPAVVYPWGVSTTDLKTPYEDTFKDLVKAATLESRYQTGNNTEILYPADGTFEDYAFWKHGIWSLLFELGFTHTPDATAVKNMIDVNMPGLRRFLEQAPKTRATDHAFTGRCDSRSIQRVILE